MIEVNYDAKKVQGLGPAARASLLWGGGFTIVRDIAQFGTMLVLVRLLSPSDYGSYALAQSIIGFLSVFSFGTLVLHALQLRDPAEIDWQAHFTAAVVINTILCAITIVVAWTLSLNQHYKDAAMPLAALSLVFLVEIPGSLRHRMVQVDHDWRRFRLLLLTGSLLALAVGLLIGVAGGGVWALVVQPPLFGIPAAVDLLIKARWRPDFTWSWARYKNTARFGLTRMGSEIFHNCRQITEQARFAGVYDFATLGIFTRAIGLAMLTAGRIGTIAVDSLYPVITRVERGSEQFRRYADFTLRGVTWATCPAGAYLAVSAHDIVHLLYGAKWDSVIQLLPLAAASVAIAGIAAAASSLLLASEQLRAWLGLDLVSAGVGIGLAFFLVPSGPSIYLTGVIAASSVMLSLTLGVLAATRAISAKAILIALFPAMVAALGAIGAVFEIRSLFGISDHIWVRLVLDGFVLSSSYLIILRFAFSQPLRELVEVLPGRAMIGTGLLISSHR